MTKPSTTALCYSWMLRTAQSALDRRDDYAIGNIISSISTQAVRRRLNIRQHKRTAPELRRDISDAIDDAIDALNSFRGDLL